ncbi:MAG: glycosyltransferase family 9 protein [Lentisphaerae bacterium]|nr:glycosyltransferase family 9 protein [Lentisphaerota bacterium]
MKVPIQPSDVKRILVVKLSSLGDLFHALPAVHNLKAVSGAAVDWLVQPEYADLVRCFTDVDRVIVFPRRGLLSGGAAFLDELQRDTYDLVVDLQGLLKSAIPARLARGALRIGPSFHREGARLFYDTVAGPRNKERHAVEENVDVVRRLGWPELPIGFPVRFPPQPAPGVSPRVVVVPASRWETKNWPVEGFVEVAEDLLHRGATVVLVGAAAEKPACDAIAEKLGPRPNLRNLAGRTTLLELGGLLQLSHLAITVDSGPMHMAAALGVPVLALFGPTDPVRTGPYGPKARVLTTQRMPCQPCLAATCDRHDLACMRRIFPSQVLAAALEMLGARRGGER